MLIACFLFFVIIANIVIGLIFLFSKKNRTLGIWMITIPIAFVGFLYFIEKKPVAEAPDTEELVGVWECWKLPKGFTDEAGEIDPENPPRLTPWKDGRLSVQNLPHNREPYRYVSQETVWELVRPGATPSGIWSVQIGNDTRFLRCKRRWGTLFLDANIDVTYRYAAEFRKVSDDPDHSP